MVSPQPAERESPEVVDLPSQPAECGSAHLQSSEVGDTKQFGSKQPVTSKGTQQYAEN